MLKRNGSQAIYKTQNPIVALCALYFRPAKYIKMAVEHDIANEFANSSYQADIKAGNYHPESKRNTFTENNITFKGELKKSVKDSFIWALSISLLTLILAWLIGKINFSFPLDLYKLYLAISSGLGVWGAALQLVPSPQSYKKNTLAEKIHSFISIVLFVPISIATLLQVIY